MLNEVYEKIEAVLTSLDTGGEQSRAFAGEIKLLQEAVDVLKPICHQQPGSAKRQILANKLRCLAVEAEGILIQLPKGPIAQWFDGTYQDAAVDTNVEKIDLARLPKFIGDVGIVPDA